MLLNPDLEALHRTNRERLLHVFDSLRERFIQEHLSHIGFSSLEGAAEWERVPDAIKKAIPEALDRSFGLVGGFGIGKTMGLASAIKRRVCVGLEERIKKIREEQKVSYLEEYIRHGALPIPTSYFWINWPGDSVTMRNRLFENTPEVEDWVQKAMDPGLRVILDDIGAEPVAGQDWTGQTLARIIDERQRQQGRTIWTSNLDNKGLIERYGPRTFSRLQGLAPAIILPKMPDLRVRAYQTRDGP